VHLAGFCYKNKIYVLIITFFSYIFGAYCVIFRENFFVYSKLLLQFVITSVCKPISYMHFIAYVHLWKKYKEWKASRTHILYMCMCWIYSIILGLSRSASNFRWDMWLDGRKNGRGEDKIKVDVRKKYCEDERRTVSSCV